MFSGLIGVQSSAQQKTEALQYKNHQVIQQIHKLQDNNKTLREEKGQTETQVKERDQKLQENQQTIDQLNQQLQAKRESQSLIARAAAVVQPRVAYASPAPSYGGCGDNSYAQFIYQHESGCNLNAVNAGGCRGIGQACPGSKLPCGADYACQNAFFTAYANSAYGGWAGAYSFWVAHSWW